MNESAAVQAFRIAYHNAQVPDHRSAFGKLAGASRFALENHIGEWDELILARALLILRERGLPRRGNVNTETFETIVKAVKMAKEIQNDDSRNQTR